jgi:nucleotide-binding universal stress UspA family protein
VCEEDGVPYDQLLKDLLRTFFPDFMEHFFPGPAARLDLRQVTFLEQEIATDLGQARRRELDLVAQAATKGGEPELILVHIELQARPEPGFPRRMFEYYALLRGRHHLPVLPIVVYVAGGRSRRQWEWYREEVLGEQILTFRYRQLRLKALKAEEAVRTEDPLVCALAVLMDRRGADLAVLKAQSLEKIGQSGLDEVRQWLLANLVETYLPLTAASQRRYEQLLAREEYQMAKRWDYHAFRDQMREEGLMSAKREDILTVLRARFTPLPDDLTRRIEAIVSPSELDALLVRAATAVSLDEVRASLLH